MAIITTDTFLDDGVTARTAGEVWDMNGGILTIRTDTRVHSNAPAGMTGTLAAMAISPTLGGGVLIDARNVRQIDFDSGTGNVPAIGTIVSQWAVEWYLLGVYANYTSAPTTPGDPMPTTGFMKFREITGWILTPWALTGIDANCTTAERSSWIEVVRRGATAMTVPRLGFCRTRGDWFMLDNTNGSAGQIIQIPTNGGGAGTRVPSVWIETGVGTDVYEAFPGVSSFYFNTTNLGTDDRSKFVMMDENGAVRIGGDGTDAIGFLPPSGCRVRIPNILGRQSRLDNGDENNIVPSIAGTSPTGRPTFATTSAGVIDFEYFMNDWYHIFSSAYSVRILHSATLDTHLETNVATPSYLENLIVGCYHNFANTTLGSLNLTNNSSGGIVKNCKFYRSGRGSSRFPSNMAGCLNYIFENFETGIIEYERFNNQYFNLSLSDNNVFLGTTKVVNSSLRLTQSSANTFDKIRHIDRFVGITNNLTPFYAINIINKSNGNRVNSLDFGGYDCHPYSGVVSMSNSSFNVIKNGGSFSNPIGGTTALSAYISVDGGNCVGNKVSNIYLKGTRTNIILSPASSKDGVYQKLYGTVGNLINAGTNTIVRAFKGNTSSVVGQLSAYGYHFSDIFLNDTEGVVRLAFNEPTSQTANQFEVVSLGAGVGFTSTGFLSMPNLGDQVIWTMDTFVKGHTGFRDVAPLRSGTGFNNFSYEYDIDTGAGFSGVYETLNTTNLTAEIVNATTGFRFKYRITCTNAVLTNAISFVTVYTESTAIAQENIYYPFEFYNINLNWILANTRLQVYDVTNDQELYNSVITTAGTFTRQFEFTNDFTARFRLMLMTSNNAYEFIEFTENITINWLTRTVDYSPDTVYNANEIDGTAVTSIVIDDWDMLVNIDTGLISRQEIYAYETYRLYTEEGIRDEGRFIEAVDRANYILYDFKIKNVTSPSIPIAIVWGYGVDSVTKKSIDLIDTTWGTLFNAPDHVVAFGVDLVPELTIINNNVKKASLLIPATQNI